MLTKFMAETSPLPKVHVKVTSGKHFIIIPCNNKYYSKIASLLHNIFILKTVMYQTTVKIYFNYQISNMFRSVLTIIRDYVQLHGEQ